MDYVKENITKIALVTLVGVLFCLSIYFLYPSSTATSSMTPQPKPLHIEEIQNFLEKYTDFEPEELDEKHYA